MNRAAIFIVSLLISLQAQAWVVNADFENGSIGQKAGGDGGLTDPFKTVITNEKVHSGEKAAKASITQGEKAFGDWGGQIVFPSKINEGGEVWFRVWLYLPDGFDFSCNCVEGVKFMRLHTPGGGYTEQLLEKRGMVIASGTWSDEFYKVNHPWPYEDIRGIGQPNTTGTWHAYEMYVKYSSVRGKSIIRAWQDGKLIFEDKKTPTLKTSSSYADYVWIFSYWNNGAPKSQSVYLDDVVVTNERPSNTDAHGNPFIGVGNADFKSIPNTAAPNPPILQ